MYIKLILRGMLRHRKKGKRLFVLISLSIAVIIFLLSAMESFYQRYLDLGIDSATGHMVVVSPESPRLSDSIWSSSNQKLPLIAIDASMRQFIRQIPGVLKDAPVVETAGVYYSLDGEVLYAYPLKAIRSEDLRDIFPGIRLINGTFDYAYKKGSDVPILRMDVQRWEKVENSRTFTAMDFKQKGADFEEFKKQVFRDFLISQCREKDCTEKSFEGGKGTGLFIDELNTLLLEPGLYAAIPSQCMEVYNWRIDDVLSSLKALQKDDKAEISLRNKQLLQAIYPDDIAPVREEISLNKELTLAVSPAKNITKLSSPSVIPVRIAGFIEIMPLYYWDNIIDLAVLQEYLKLEQDECTSYVIRLSDTKLAPVVKKDIEDYISVHNLPYKVIDYEFMGKTHMPTALAVRIVLVVLIILFIIAVVFFIVNMVSLSIIKRRREIGTSISLGMSNMEIAAVFFGEIFMILFISWFAGSVIGTGIMYLFEKVGIPGIIFFQNSRLYLIFNLNNVFISFFAVVPAALFATFLSLLPVRAMKAVDLLRETK